MDQQVLHNWLLGIYKVELCRYSSVCNELMLLTLSNSDELVAPLLPVQPFSYLYSGGWALWKGYNLEESTGYTWLYRILAGMVHMV